MANQNFTLTHGGKEVSFTLTDLPEQANGAIQVRMGDTVILVTSVMSRNALENPAFFPLTVDYEERFYAAGKILGSRFVRREGRPSDEAVITARLIDRAIRPLFPKRFNREVQVIATCLSWDAQNDPDILGLWGASLALSISNIPWQGPVAAVRVAKVQVLDPETQTRRDAFVINPTYEERTQSTMDFIAAGVREGNDFLLNMIEAEGEQVSEEDFEQAFDAALPFFGKFLDLQEEIQKTAGKKKLEFQAPAKDEALEQRLRAMLGNRLQDALFTGDRTVRMEAVDAIKAELLSSLEDKAQIQYAKDFLEEEIDSVVHDAAILHGKRVDDRKLDQVRELRAEAGILPRTHGSGLFGRGQTKTLSLLTLGAPGDQKILEGMEFIGKKRFMHHYNFPPFAPGEVRPLRGPGRREIGHGILAEKALLPVIPEVEEFPYTIRIVTEVLSSNGSTSMASCCSSSLALLDAGVPIKNAVAGISVGLMSNDKGDYRLLCDIQGPEDHYGDMDFKVAGTVQGICAIQLDVKVKGISKQIFKEALAIAKKTRLHILQDVIFKVLEKPRQELSKWAPRILTLTINPEKIGLVIGPGGKMINKIIEETGAEIDIDDSGAIFITSVDQDKAQRAVDLIRGIVKEVKAGEMYTGKVKRILDFGAFVEILPNQEGLVHISQLADKRVEKVTDVVKVGDVIEVKVIEIDAQGRVNLSLKAAKNG